MENYKKKCEMIFRMTSDVTEVSVHWSDSIGFGARSNGTWAFHV